jgi:predicted dehydrogenase
MSSYTVGFIGTGPEPDNPVWGESAAMAYQHAAGYDRLEECKLLACADLVPENARAFAEEWDIEDPTAIDLAIEHLIACLDRGEEPELSARRALDCTEVIFGAYESSRRRGRVEFPLDVDDNPLEAMVESGELTPEPAEE